jgi:hypothetical protein
MKRRTGFENEVEEISFCVLVISEARLPVRSLALLSSSVVWSGLDNADPA